MSSSNVLLPRSVHGQGPSLHCGCLLWFILSGDVSGSPVKNKKRRKPGPEGPQKKYKQMQFTGQSSTLYVAYVVDFLAL